MGENWDDSTQSKEQIEASLISRQEAAIRRERALAYAFSHQVRHSQDRVSVYIYFVSFATYAYTVFQFCFFFPVEEYFKARYVCRHKQPTMGLELAGALDGSKALGGA
jgi:hypothetical protein